MKRAVCILTTAVFAVIPASALADVPNVNAQRPPGIDKFLTLLRWLLYGVGLIGVAGMLIVAGTMMVAHRRGGHGEHGSALGMVFAGCALAAASVPLVNAIL